MATSYSPSDSKFLFLLAFGTNSSFSAGVARSDSPFISELISAISSGFVCHLSQAKRSAFRSEITPLRALESFTSTPYLDATSGFLEAPVIALKSAVIWRCFLLTIFAISTAVCIAESSKSNILSC